MPEIAPIDRRDFLRVAAQLGLGMAACPAAVAQPRRWRPSSRKSVPTSRMEVAYYEKLGGGTVQCLTCPHECMLGNGEWGKCRAKRSIAGKHYLEGYGSLCVLNRDPIEKGPLYHVRPGSKIISVASGGCNLRCLYCQNWQFSQKRPTDVARLNLTPQAATSKVKSHGLAGIAFTYTDPVAYYEYARDTSEKARAAGLVSAFCTDGYINPEPLKALCQTATSFTITLKAFSEERYQELAQVSMKPVLDAMKVVKEQGVWLEVVSLIVPGINDRTSDVRKWGKWIVKELGRDVPWHFSRFVPSYKLRTTAQTPVRTLEACRKAALGTGLRYVYVTNVAPHEGNHTYCPRCKRKVIERLGFKVLKNRLRGGRCSYCRTPIAGVWV